MPTPEGLIKNQICHWLALYSKLFWVQQAGKIPGRINRSRFLRNGISDILGVWDGKMLAIEVKAPGGKLSNEQADFLDKVNLAGGIGFVAYSVEDVIKALGKK